jgi:hypothetical protein
LAATSDVELDGVVPRFTRASVLLAAMCDARPTGAATPKSTGAAVPKLGGGASVLLAVTYGGRPSTKARGASVKEQGPTGKGTQSMSERKSKVDEGGAKILAKGNEASSKVT